MERKNKKNVKEDKLKKISGGRLALDVKRAPAKTVRLAQGESVDF